MYEPRSTRLIGSAVALRLAILTVAAAFLMPAGASNAQDMRTSPCSPVIDRTQGNATVTFSGGCTAGITQAEIKKIVESVLAERPAPSDLAGRFEKISKEFGVTDTALTAFFHILGESKVSDEELDAKLREIAARHLTLLKHAEASADDDPLVAVLKKEALAAATAGDYARAETMLQQAFEADLAAVHGAEAVFNARRLTAAKTKADLAELKLTLLQYAAAADELREAADLVPPAEALVRAQYLNRLGATALDAANFPLADRTLSEALRIRESKLNPEHPDVAVSLDHLAEVLRNTNRMSEAEPLYRRALAIMEKSYGADDPRAKTVRENLRRLRDKMAGQPGAPDPKSTP